MEVRSRKTEVRSSESEREHIKNFKSQLPAIQVGQACWRQTAVYFFPPMGQLTAGNWFKMNLIKGAAHESDLCIGTFLPEK